MLTCQHDWCLISTWISRYHLKASISSSSSLALLVHGVRRNCLPFTQWLLNLANYQVHPWNFWKLLSHHLIKYFFYPVLSHLLLGFQLRVCLIIWCCLRSWMLCSVLLPTLTHLIFLWVSVRVISIFVVHGFFLWLCWVHYSHSILQLSYWAFYF